MGVAEALSRARTTCLIRMRKTAICGTDIHIYQWDAWAQRTIPVPMQVGHEYCGEIVALGERGARPRGRRPRLGG